MIFYIYGGVYKTGSNTANGPYYVMSNDVILVMPNYRGGALGKCPKTAYIQELHTHSLINMSVSKGFLSTGDTVIPGNFALKDQLLAMKWTRENIQYFGGDPNRVTMQGHSSGAMMAHMHTLVPLSKGIF